MQLSTKIIISVVLVILLLVPSIFLYYKYVNMEKELMSAVHSKMNLEIEKQIISDDLERLRKSAMDREFLYNSHVNRIFEIERKYFDVTSKLIKDNKVKQMDKIIEARPETLEKIINGNIEKQFKCIENATNSKHDVSCNFDVFLHQNN